MTLESELNVIPEESLNQVKRFSSFLELCRSANNKSKRVSAIGKKIHEESEIGDIT